MKKLTGFVVFIILIFTSLYSLGQKIKTGADQPEKYLPLLKNKNIGLVVNHTSLIGETHLVDFLMTQECRISAIFAPEHGFRGDHSAGAPVADGVDEKTGAPVISLYGESKKPQPGHLNNLDVVVFDIQDVGCRFYTYISTLHLVIEACAENKIPVIVLDRPNPNGDYVAGPVLEPEFRSFVGMDPIPVVHGCTVGELANMINEEGWHNAHQKCSITVIEVLNYTHQTTYKLPVRPSPNLPNYLSVRLYPSLCFFEATRLSIGRGTDFPFQIIGGTNPELGSFTFTPRSIPTASVNPPNKGKLCYGIDLRGLENPPAFTLKYFLDFYNKFHDKTDFLVNTSWFNKLAGNEMVLKQIEAGKSEREITKSWQESINHYKQIRKKYLLYRDFE